MADAINDIQNGKKVVNENGFERKWFSSSAEVKKCDHPLLRPKGVEKFIFTWKYDGESRE